MTTDTETLNKFYEIVISISGILFPVFQAVLFFIIEKSFNKLEYSRQELINFYQKQWSIISLSLIYLILQSIFQLLVFKEITTILLFFYLLLLIIFRVQLLHSTGVWNTMFTTKYIPKERNIYIKYIIWCWNNTNIEKIKFTLFIIFLVIYPLINEDKIFISVLSSLIYSLINIALLLHNPLVIQKEILKIENTSWYELNNNENNWKVDKIKNEELLIKKQIQGEYLNQENIEDTTKMFSFSTYINVKDTGELWNNVFLKEINIQDREIFKNRVMELSKNYLIKLSECKSDINSFVLSFHFKLENKERNIFIRINKNEVINNKNLSVNDFFKELKNVLIDEILK